MSENMAFVFNQVDKILLISFNWNICWLLCFKNLLFLICMFALNLTHVTAQTKTQLEIDDAILQKYFKENKIKPQKNQ